MTSLVIPAGLAAREWARLRLGCVAVSAALFALAVVVLGALTPGYSQWSETVSRLASPGERWALAARAVFIVYGLLVIAGAGTLRHRVQRRGGALVLLLSLYGVTCVVAGLAPKDQPGVHTITSQVHVASTVAGGALAIGAMLLVARYGLTRRDPAGGRGAGAAHHRCLGRPALHLGHPGVRAERAGRAGPGHGLDLGPRRLSGAERGAGAGTLPRSAVI